MEPVHVEEAEGEAGLGEAIREMFERRGLAHSVRTIEKDAELSTRHVGEPTHAAVVPTQPVGEKPDLRRENERGDVPWALRLAHWIGVPRT